MTPDNISIDQTTDLSFLEELNITDIRYWGQHLMHEDVRRRLQNSLSLNKENRIFVIRKNSKISCFFSYIELKDFPFWLISNMFTTSNVYYSPNVIGFGYGMDEAVRYAESRNIFGFFWVVPKDDLEKRNKIGFRDIEKRNSILKEYSFSVVHDSTQSRKYLFTDIISGNPNFATATMLATRKIL